MMKRKILFPFLTASVLCIPCLLSSCKGSSSSNATISGKVIDSEVADATVKLFSDADMTTQIGSGTTDSDGEFTNITLTVATVPDPIYGYSKGGTLVDTGLPAPTMYFAGSKDATTGEIYITPLSHFVFEKVNSGSTVSAAQASIASALGVESDEVAADPTVDSETATAVNRALASGTQGVSPAAGTYTVHLLLLGQEDIDSASADRQFPSLTELEARMVSFEVTVAAGKQLEGTASLDLDWDGDDEDFEIVGGINGNFAFMQIEEEDDEAAGAYNWKFSLEFGLMGSFFGTCWRSQFDGGILDQYGLCVGTFTHSDATSTQLDAAKTTLSEILAGDAYLLYRDVVIPIDPMAFSDPAIGAGNITLAADSTPTTGFDYTNLDINDVDYNGGFNGVTETAVFTNATGDMDYFGSSRLLGFSEDSGTDRIFFAMAAGARKGLYFVTDTTDDDKVLKIGLLVINASESLAKVLEPGESYDIRSAFGSPLFQGMERSAALALVAPNETGLVTGPSLNGDGLSLGSAYSPSGNGEIVSIAGPCVVIKQDIDGDFDDSPEDSNSDSLVFVEMFESLAMAGIRLETGEIDLPGNPGQEVRRKPATAQVISGVKQGDSVLEFKGDLDFLYHKFDGGLGGQGDNIEDTIIYLLGTLTLNTAAGTASLDLSKVDGVGYESGNGETVTFTTVERVSASSNLIHFSGSFVFEDVEGDEGLEEGVGTVIFDFWWPIGGPKGVALVSVDENGDGTYVVNEVGEFFVSR